MNQLCGCGKWAVEKTSWTEYNPGRRFLTCSTGECNYFRWSEEEFDSRARSVINGLLRRFRSRDDTHMTELVRLRDVHNEELAKAKEEARKWKFFAVCCYCMSFIVGIAQLKRMLKVNNVLTSL